jgi:hypothetical protein
MLFRLTGIQIEAPVKPTAENLLETDKGLSSWSEASSR